MKAKNEKHSTCLLKTVQEAGLILLFVGEVDHQSCKRRRWRPRREQSSGYPDSGFSLIPAFPAATAASGIGNS